MTRAAMRSVIAGLALLALGGCSGDSTSPPLTSSQPTGDISIDNVTDGETISYPLLILSGRVGGSSPTVEVSVDGGAARSWPASVGRFKAVVSLALGMNRIEVRAAGLAPAAVTVSHEPRDGEEHRVRLVYLATRDGDASFQGFIPGEPNDMEAAVRRLRFNGRLLQSAYAEMMNNAGRGRKTFEFMQHHGEDIVFVERFHLTDADIDRYRLLCDATTCQDGPAPYLTTFALWGEINHWMDQTSDPRTTKNLVYMSFTRMVKDEAAGRSILYGGGTLGGYLTATVHGTSLGVYPENLDELQVRLLDRRQEADYGMNEIGAGSLEFWQSWARALGGAGHEIGHSFGLAHANEYEALMARGFDIFNRLFAPSDGSGSSYPAGELPFFPVTDENGGPHLDLLDQSPWLN